MRRLAVAAATVAALALTATFTSANTPIAADDEPVVGTITLSMSVEPGEPVPVALVTEQAAAKMYEAGYFGQGIDVALIDSGVAPVHGLDQEGKLLYGPDLSNEGGEENLANLDTYGHGTHLAGIIAGDDGERVVGVAPHSRVVSVKVAGATGETDIAQVIAGIDWVIEHKNDPGLNIRVLNLSLGVGGLKTNEGDPLSAAVERAWDAGIVVVAAAGNRGNESPGIDSPALSPYVLAVGGTESFESSGEDDVVASWSSGGNGYRTPDVVAPGRSILSFRVPGSMLDQLHPEAAVGDRYFRGSGTSQSAAVVSGFTALLLSVDPTLTPDQVKFLYKRYADDIAEGTRLDGDGRLDVPTTIGRLGNKRYAPVQSHPRAIPSTACSTKTFQPTPTSYDLYTRSVYEQYLLDEVDSIPTDESFVLGAADDSVVDEPDDLLTNDEVLLGDLEGSTFDVVSTTSYDAKLYDAAIYETSSYEVVSSDAVVYDTKSYETVGGDAQDAFTSTPVEQIATAVPCDAWTGGSWNGATWSGGVWNGATWSGATWSGATWSGGVWNGATWSGATWSGATWSGATWSGATWSGATWSGATWSGATWSSMSKFGKAGS